MNSTLSSSVFGGVKNDKYQITNISNTENGYFLIN